MKTRMLMRVLAFGFVGVGFLAGPPAQAAEAPPGPSLAQTAVAGKFVAVEIQGVKFWLGGGDIDLRASARTPGPVTFTLINKLDAEHGFAIDGMKIKQIVKPGEEVTVSVPLGALDHALSVYKFYCHLHPGHVGGTIVRVK